MSAFALNVTGDLDISSGRLKIITGADETAQKITIRLQFFRGEWKLDLSVGMPWFQQILGIKNPNLSVVKNLIREAVETTPGVVKANNLTLAYDNTSRSLSVAFQATTDFSKPLDFSRIFVIPTPGQSL